jgi:hypothetical protein
LNNNNKNNKKNNEKFKSITRFFTNVKSLYAAALGIEILCIADAEIGENSSFALFGYRTLTGITLGYILGYGLSTFTTFATILGSYSFYRKVNRAQSCIFGTRFN